MSTKTKLIIILVFFFLFVNAAVLQDIYFIKTQKEPLLQIVNGRQVAILEQYTPIEIVEERGEWAKVKVEGWVKKSSIRTESSEPYNAKEGFLYRNFQAVPDPQINGTRITGEMLNVSEKEYKIASFTVIVYDNDDKLITADRIILNKFKPNESQPFVKRFRGLAYHRLNYYEIKFRYGSIKTDADSSDTK